MESSEQADGLRCAKYISFKSENFQRIIGELNGELNGELIGELNGELNGELIGELNGELIGELIGELPVVLLWWRLYTSCSASCIELNCESKMMVSL
jgi:hypothetical protein